MRPSTVAHLRSQAFTLVELLVVVAIIGMLASLALPSLRSAAEKAKGARCLGNLRQIGVAVQQYVADPANNNQFPPIYNVGGNGNADAGALRAVNRTSQQLRRLMAKTTDQTACFVTF